MKKLIALAVGLVILVATSISLLSKENVKVGYLLVGPKNDGGWSMRHEQGFQSLTKYGHTVTGIEMAPEAEAAKLLGKLARKNDIVFATSFGYMDGMAKAAKKHPDTVFMHATGYKGNDTNFDNYGCMSYQARYLSGIAAGMMTKTNKIGVVGSHAIPEIVRNINALTIGAQSVNPNIEVNVIWINSWFDPPKDMDAAKALLDDNNDVLFTTTDSPSVVTLAQQVWKRDGKEVWSMGNDAPMGGNGPDRYITGMMFHWSGLYQQLVSEVANGTWTPNRRLNLGLKQNCVALSPWGVNVPGKVINAVETVKTAWLDDEMDQFYPFSLGVTKRDGTKVPANTIKRGELDTMQYFVQGVNGAL